jgi:hypothetical protein
MKIFSFKSNNWINLVSDPNIEGRRNHVMTTVGKNILIHGGIDKKN